MYKMYAIPNCNTVKKAQDALSAMGIEFEFVNFKKTPPTQAQIKKWKSFFKALPVNKKGPTFRKVKDEFESSDLTAQIKLMIEYSSMIKRPIVEKDGVVVAIGFTGDEYEDFK